MDITLSFTLLLGLSYEKRAPGDVAWGHTPLGPRGGVNLPEVNV